MNTSDNERNGCSICQKVILNEKFVACVRCGIVVHICCSTPWAKRGRYCHNCQPSRSESYMYSKLGSLSLIHGTINKDRTKRTTERIKDLNINDLDYNFNDDDDDEDYEDDEEEDDYDGYADYTLRKDGEYWTEAGTHSTGMSQKYSYDYRIEEDLDEIDDRYWISSQESPEITLSRLMAFDNYWSQTEKLINQLPSSIHTDLSDPITNFIHTSYKPLAISQIKDMVNGNKAVVNDDFEISNPLPLLLLSTGFNDIDQLLDSISGGLLSRCKYNIRPPFITLTSDSCSSLKSAILLMCQQLFNINNNNNSNNNIKSTWSTNTNITYTFQDLSKWYISNYLTPMLEKLSQPPPTTNNSNITPPSPLHPSTVTSSKHYIPQVLLYIKDYESWDPKIVKDIIYICSSHKTEIPFVLILSVSTSPQLVHSNLTDDMLRLLNIREFSLHSQTEIFEKLIRKVFNEDSILTIGPEIYKVIYDSFNNHHLSIQRVVLMLKFIVNEHYFTKRFSFLCNDNFSSLFSEENLDLFTSKNSNLYGNGKNKDMDDIPYLNGFTSRLNHVDYIHSSESSDDYGTKNIDNENKSSTDISESDDERGYDHPDTQLDIKKPVILPNIPNQSKKSNNLNRTPNISELNLGEESSSEESSPEESSTSDSTSDTSNLRNTSSPKPKSNPSSTPKPRKSNPNHRKNLINMAIALKSPDEHNVKIGLNHLQHSHTIQFEKLQSVQKKQYDKKLYLELMNAFQKPDHLYISKLFQKIFYFQTVKLNLTNLYYNMISSFSESIQFNHVLYDIASKNFVLFNKLKKHIMASSNQKLIDILDIHFNYLQEFVNTSETHRYNRIPNIERYNDENMNSFLKIFGEVLELLKVSERVNSKADENVPNGSDTNTNTESTTNLNNTYEEEEDEEEDDEHKSNVVISRHWSVKKKRNIAFQNAFVKKSPILNNIAASEDAKKKLISLITKILNEYVYKDLDEPLCELFSVNCGDKLLERFLPKYYTDIKMQLAQPHKHKAWECDICDPLITNSKSEDMAIIFNILQESGKYVNIYDWLSTYYHKFQKKPEDNDSFSLELQARFGSCVDTLNTLGFIQKTLRRNEHVENKIAF